MEAVDYPNHRAVDKGLCRDGPGHCACTYWKGMTDVSATICKTWGGRQKPVWTSLPSLRMTGPVSSEAYGAWEPTAYDPSKLTGTGPAQPGLYITAAEPRTYPRRTTRSRVRTRGLWRKRQAKELPTPLAATSEPTGSPHRDESMNVDASPSHLPPSDGHASQGLPFSGKIVDGSRGGALRPAGETSATSSASQHSITNPSGSYGAIDVHMDLERDIADFRWFSKIPCVISAFAKRGDIITTDRGISFTIQKGLQISRFAGSITMTSKASKICFLASKKNVGNITDPSQDDSLHRGYVDGSQQPQLIGVFLRGLVSCPGAPDGFLNTLWNTPSILSTLQENMRAIRAVLDRVEAVMIPRPSTMLAHMLRGQELVEARLSIRLAVMAALLGKECERAARVIKAAVAKVLAKRE
ncbi:hypothetical protein EDB87DRAFT_1825331 [Lactarius vividus]|nr:hypothetical protein EDB87DRAFT_1825331 [Lactarius vividus]